MNAPQIIWIILATVGLTNSLIKDGRPQTGKHNFVASLIATALMALLLWWGGFFGGAR
ncbi:LPXTG cell wall anchor domain-containing protein [Xanthomonas sp. AM6]|uniref:LPXTG cell wall anchor domain-containing protein n=1 Tax=Xanthomonas sp. AM6 TaxID=2982531 RepID=UPI0021D8F183|nr:LPXTG cell wall anchor domain-containing protein [Xanthomonas sp. AM6]UYB51176.1 LPXTG cell wall anchor domain-containing protein [Xanthomonas sp. AM6]